MTDLERRVEELRTQIVEVGERVRIDAVAVEFLAGEPRDERRQICDHTPIGQGDRVFWPFKVDGGTGTVTISWCRRCGSAGISGGALGDAIQWKSPITYTRDEVAEIVAKAVMQALSIERLGR